jgi:hypothetical protein
MTNEDFDFALILLIHCIVGQTSFEKYFTDKVLRFDFMLAGNSNKTVVYPVGMKEEPWFAGSHAKSSILLITKF